MRWLIAALVIGLVGSARATDGNQLYAWVPDYEAMSHQEEHADRMNAGLFAGFVVGVTEALEYREGGTYRTICFSKNVTNQEDADVVVKYLRDHPEERHLP